MASNTPIRRLLLPQGDSIDLPEDVCLRLDVTRTTLRVCAEQEEKEEEEEEASRAMADAPCDEADELVCTLRGVLLNHYGPSGCHVSCGGLLVALQGRPDRWLPAPTCETFVRIHVIQRAQ